MNKPSEKTNKEITIETSEECRDIVIALASQARKYINIFTQDMDAPLYNNDDFEKHIFNFATERKNAVIRILVQDSSRAIKDSHRIIRLAQRLTSFIFIRNPGEAFKNERSAYMTVDGTGILYRARGDRYNYHATANFMSPPQTDEVDVLFEEIWQQSEPDPRARRFFI